MENFLALERYTFNRSAIDRAPLAPGVYGIFDKKELIYIGYSGEGREQTIRESLSRHLDGRYGGCTGSATRYCWEITIACGARAHALRARFDAMHLRAPRCQTAAQ